MNCIYLNECMTYIGHLYVESTMLRSESENKSPQNSSINLT